MNTPIGIQLLAGVRWRVAASEDREPQVSLDVPGAMVLIGSVMAVVLGAAFLENGASRVLGAGVVALCILGAFLLARWMKRAADPIIPPSALRQPKLSLGTFGSFINTATTSSTSAHAVSSAAASAHAFPDRPRPAAGPPCGDRRLQHRRAGDQAFLPPDGDHRRTPTHSRRKSPRAFTLTSVAGIVAAVSLIGFGLGLSSVGRNDLGTDLPESHVSPATGLLNTGAQVGTVLGAALLVLVASAGTYGPLSAYAAGLFLAAATALATAAIMARKAP